MKIDVDMTIAVVLAIALGLIAFGMFEALSEPEPVYAATVAEDDVSAADISALIEEAKNITKHAAEGGHDAVG